MAQDEQDPRLADLIARLESGADEGPLPVRRFGGVRVSVEEVRHALAKHPNHPVAWVYARATEGLPGNEKVVVDKIDLLGLAKNHVIRKRRVVIDGEVHLSKDLGASLDRPARPVVPPVTTKTAGAGDNKPAGESGPA